MEDGITDIKGLDFSITEESEEKEQSSSGGVINNLISALVSKDGNTEEEGKESGVIEQSREEEEKESGIIDHLISPKVREDHTCSSEIKMNEDNSINKGGGILNSLIAGILHQSEGRGEANKEKDEGNETEAGNGGGGGGGGGGLIDDLISHLPTHLVEDTAPSNDEASILIHSIVHD